MINQLKLIIIHLSDDAWRPMFAKLNDYQFKLVKVAGDFVWHNHLDTDETFIVIKGTLTVEFRDKTVLLNAGEMLVVAKGVEHKPSADSECQIMIVEPKGVINTGENAGNLTAENDVWI